MNNLNNINNNPDLHKKGTIIIVNGRSIETFEKKLTFEQIVQLAFNEYTPSESTVYYSLPCVLHLHSVSRPPNKSFPAY